MFLAIIIMAGRGEVEDFTDEAQVKEYLKNVEIEYSYSCYREKAPDGCHRLGHFYANIIKEKGKAEKVLKMNCFQNHFGQSCDKLADMYLIEKGNNLDSDGREELVRLYELGCQYNYLDSCHNLGYIKLCKDKLWQKFHSVKGGRDLLHESCMRGNIKSCSLLQDIFINRNFEKAFEYAKRGCEQDHYQSCVNLGVMYRKGEGVERNEDLFKQIRKKAEDLRKNLTPPKADESIIATM